MKKIIINISLFSALLIAGCTKNFDDINTDPTKASASNFDPNLLLPSGELGYLSATTGYSGPILFQSMWVQTFASAIYPGYYSNGDKYVFGGSYLSYQQSTWNNAYNAASYLYEVQNLTKDKPELSNLSGIALIVELLNIEAVTDTYGDCPFSQALQAKAGITAPVYDAQQDVYNSMLSKLDSVISTLDASKATPTNDALPYKGDIAKWKKFGYSLMLRMAMRLTKADAATAKQYAEKAYAGGTFASNDDNAYILYDLSDGFTNSNTNALKTTEDYSEVKWGKALIDYLKSTDDPRLSVIAEVPQTGTTNAANQSLAGNSDPSVQVGMPNGYDQNGGSTDISKEPNYPGVAAADPAISGDKPNVTGKYSRPKTALYLSQNAPAFILTYAQTEFLLAEAAARGWNVGATATQHYANAIAASLQTYSTYNSTGNISASTATAYAASHPLDVSSMEASLKQINTEYWVLESTIFDFSEAWSNWRRSGYPVLTPVNYTGNFSNATIPRRQAYPTGEASTNPANYKAAVSGLSNGDTYTSRVWWDK
ncbi:MAG TPA: SusD/RagB family nutrient-binding outer membrane lipoprotein [Chitinophagaceae bacterium]|nr:SusD/RagB family nutrient-binding outer membrane lipoprotein [Chitinophagaceae bacterium]